jgi:uncharacterized protein (DUF4213/DUF364 family)
MKEPLAHFHSIHGFDRSFIRQLVCGEVYLGLMLDNGHIGVCSTMQQKVNLSIHDLDTIDHENISHRMVLTAYYNALFNYSNQYPGSSDIFDEINFRQFNNIVMIGYFQSLLKKFQRENIDITVFDNLAERSWITEPGRQPEYIKNAEAVILTGTSVFNNTFSNIVSWSKPGCEIFVLGPSTILHPDMFLYGNITVLFGALFALYDTTPLKIIKEGKGTRDFLPYMKKVYLKRME